MQKSEQASPMTECGPEAGHLREVPSPVKGANDEAFIYAISHDVRSSARALMEIPTWLQEDIAEAGLVLPANVKDSFELLQRHAKRLDRMLRDLLSYSRAGRLQTAEPIELRAACREALRLIALPPWLNVDHSGLKGVIVAGEQDTILMFQHIIENAAHHGDPGGTTLVIESRVIGSMLSVTFADDGPGVADSAIDRIFLPMKTLRRRDEFDSSGLGLTTVHKIVTVNGGRVFAGPAKTGRGFVLRADFPVAQS